MAITHTKVSAVADGADTDLVRPVDWNAEHTIDAGTFVRTATLVVAASNSSANGIAQADYVCDGVDDDVEIQAAIDALSAGGLLSFSEGTFNLATTLNFGSGHITLRGSNSIATILKATTAMTNMLTKTTNVARLVIEDICFDCNAGTATNGINLTDAAPGAYLQRLNRIRIIGYSGYGLIMDGNEDSPLSKSMIENPSGAGKGILWQVSGGNVDISTTFVAGDIEIAAQICIIRGSTIMGVRAVAGGIGVLNLNGSYFNNALSTNIAIDAGAAGITNLEVNSCLIGFIATGNLLAGSFTNKVILRNNWIHIAGGGTVTVLPNLATLYGGARVEYTGTTTTGTVQLTATPWTPGVTLDADISTLSRRNAIINGSAMVNQRVTAYTLVKDTYGICADRFYGMATGTAVSAGTFTAAYGFSSGETEGAYGFQFAGVTLTGTGIIYLRYRMEAADAVKFRGKTASFSCKVKHDVGSNVNYTVYIRKANASDNFAAVTAIADSGAVAIATGTATALTLLATSMGECQNGVEIEIKVECGAITTKAFNFGDVQFELGSVATPFEFRPYQQELALCQRYYQILGGLLGFAHNTSSFRTGIAFPVVMRDTPTVGLASSLTISNGAADFSQTAANVSLTTGNIAGCSLALDNFNAALTAGASYFQHGTSGGRITFGSEL